MTPDELDQVYAELSNALERVGPQKAQLMLATLSLALLVEVKSSLVAREKIAQAERLAMAH